MKYIIGTRGSKLALKQAEYVKYRLEEVYTQDEFEIQIVRTKGDLIQDKPLDQIGDKGLFVSAIEEKILSGEIHLGVHSMKDMPAIPAKGLCFTKTWEREDPRDVLILREEKALEDLPQGAVIGTGSKRRAFQLLKIREDLKIVDIRGNVDTRLRKMQEQELDGIVLAAAGLKRLGMETVITQYLEPEQMISAPAQGALALEIREDMAVLREMLDALGDERADRMVRAERAFLKAMDADCHVPVGAICREKEGGKLYLQTMFGDAEGERLVFAEAESTADGDPFQLAKEAAEQIQCQMTGKVYLIGAGPGDAGLITVKGLSCIRQADCIIYDRLIPEQLLSETKAGCRQIYAGKENHHHTMGQGEMNELLVECARKYNVVVRLKGGDPYVFGRGGEEGIFLREHAIPFEVVPGISSALAGLAYAGIPITHRGISTGFHVVTAHNRRDELAEIDFHAMAQGKDTCVFLMGLSKLREITNHLLDAGMSGKTPAAVISHAATPRQKTCVSDLEHLASKVEQEKLSSPALIVVGEVVELREQLCTFERKPLFGKRYLVPKIGKKTSRLTEHLREKGAAVDEIMVGEIRFLDVTFHQEELGQVDWLIFTSRNGVEAFFSNLFQSGLDVRALHQAKIAAIGPSTANALMQHGIHADLIPEEYNSDALGAELSKAVQKEEQVWYIKEAYSKNGLANKLSYCKTFREIGVYENQRSISEPDTILNQGMHYDGIFFTCASSASRLLENRPNFVKEINENISIYSIGPKCTQQLEELGCKQVLQSKEARYVSLAEKAE